MEEEEGRNENETSNILCFQSYLTTYYNNILLQFTIQKQNYQSSSSVLEN